MHRPITELLADLDGIATRLIPAPHVAFGYRRALTELRTEVTEAIARPATERVIDDCAAMLVTCLLNMARNGDARRWIEIAKVLWPHVQASLKAAREHELREMMDHS
jgi:hypothetical protein